MTVAECKQLLPSVKIKFMGQTWNARVTGRQNQFASVSPFSIERNGRIDTIQGPTFEYAWETVARAATNNTTLLT